MDCLNAGADAIWISNGSHLKPLSSPCTINVLKQIATEVKLNFPEARIFIDSGIRRGTDVLKCLALGADAIFIARPVMWALNCGGYDSVKDMVCMLNEETRLAMAHTSCMKIADVTEKQVIHMIRPRL